MTLITAVKDTRTDQNRTNGMGEDNVKPKECYGTFLVLMIEHHFTDLSILNDSGADY